jgi:N-acetyl-gamma-glutamyl-phosphate reductase
MKKLKVAIVGANGYAGGEMVRILAGHPSVDIVALTSRQFAGKHVTEVFPSLGGILDMSLVELDTDDIAGKCDVVFLAIPHAQAMPIVAELVGKGVRVIDYSADFRLNDQRVYEQWYKTPHTCPDLLKQSVYGLAELNRGKIEKAELVALPGCYPTGALLALAPAVKQDLIDLNDIVINSLSGVSGAGQKPTPQTHFPEIADNARAYGVTSHRHTPEIEQELSSLAGENVRVLFTPHLIPANRGILTTATGRCISDAAPQKLLEIYAEFYSADRFIRLCNPGSFPEIRFVRGSNYCDIGIGYDERTRKLIVISAIDNLCKGAAGQGVQCMNIMFGLPEQSGLEFGGLTP